MAPRSLIDPLTASASGGVAARRGFRYQDHVAASFFIDLLSKQDLWQLECESADDIVLRWETSKGRATEYVQVKTTDDDFKWSFKELMERTNKKPGTSVAERSLACDKFTDQPLFRIVSLRDVRNDLRLFKVPRDERHPIEEALGRLTARFGRLYKTVRSQNERSLQDWAERLYWQVEFTASNLKTNTINRLIRLANGQGEMPSVPDAEKIYLEIINTVGDAADADPQLQPDEKAITREEAWTWWRGAIERLRQDRLRGVKVYQVRKLEFFAEVHALDEARLRRGLRSYDAQYDQGRWRSQELADYLLSWLPEISLQARILAGFDHLHGREMTRRAVREYERKTRIDDERLVAELLLHGILRHYSGSEPIACKLFEPSAPGSPVMGAHIVHNPSGDELWLGQARLAAAHTYDQILEAAISAVKELTDRHVLQDERDLIIQLREPQHLQTTNLETAFSPIGKLEDIVKALRVPILIGYESSTLGAGFSDSYVEALKEEVADAYAELKDRLPDELKGIEVRVFLIPIESVDKLVQTFGELLRSTK